MRDLPYWIQALLWSWAGALGWGTIGILIGAWLGVRDVRKERDRQRHGRKPRQNWLGV